MPDLEQKFNHIQKLLESGIINHKEYSKLITSLNLEHEIRFNAKELQKNPELYDCMLKAIAVSKTI